MLHRPRSFDAERWDVSGTGGVCRVRRPRRGNSAEYEYAKDAAGKPLELTKDDAIALVALLNGLLREARELADARRSVRARRAG